MAEKIVPKQTEVNTREAGEELFESTDKEALNLV